MPDSDFRRLGIGVGMAALGRQHRDDVYALARGTAIGWGQVRGSDCAVLPWPLTAVDSRGRRFAGQEHEDGSVRLNDKLQNIVKVSADPMSRRSTRPGPLAVALIGLCGALSLAACAPTIIKHGHQFQDNDIQQIQTGMSLAQVAGTLGSPTTTATVGGNQTYYYIASTEKQTAFFTPEETDRKVLAVYFSPLGAVERVSHYGLKDGKVINFSANQTANTARDENVIKQDRKSVV